MIQNLTVSRFVVLAGYASIWLMDRYMLEQVGSWKDAIFNRKSTSRVGIHAADTYTSQVATPTLVDVHFAARFYTWAIWSWARASQFHLVNLVGTGNKVSDYLQSKLVYWKVTLWTNSLFWRALNTGYIPNMISSMLYLILLGFGITYILN